MAVFDAAAKRMSSLRQRPLHPIFFLTYPVLALLAANAEQVHLSVVWRPLVVSLLIGSVLWFLLSLLLDASRAALLVSFAALLFFSYGHVYDWTGGLSLAGDVLGRHRYLLPLWLGLLGLGSWAILRTKDARSWNGALNLIGVVLIAMPLVQLVAFGMRSQQAIAAHDQALVDPATEQEISLSAPDPSPDIYYIILDAYGRSDSLRHTLDIDNRGFLEDLKSHGFYVASCSQSNYAQTELSFASALNMAYLDQLGGDFKPDRDDRTPLVPLIKDSLVRRLLEAQGYRVVAFETGFTFSELRDADEFIAPRVSGLKGGLSGFEGLLLRSSGALVLLDASRVLPRFLVPDVNHRVVEHRQRTLLTLDTMDSIASEPAPKFVFAHVVSPHTPFVFGPDETAVVDPFFVGPDEAADQRMAWYRQGYADQIAYLHSRMIPIVEGLLADSQTEPVIVIQGDHGPEEGGSGDRMEILNAYHLPGDAEAALYPEITPINSFRVIFDQVFGAELPIQADKSYFSVYNRPYDFSIVANEGCNTGD
ncbi:MAG: hypothetical protein WBR18_03110 [Anaerolineales bacterium]